MDEARYRQAERRLWESVGATPSEQRLHLPRNDVDVRIQEVGDGDPVVFVHGASNSGTSWADLVVRLPGFRCILLDRPGCGLSDAIPRAMDREGLRRYAQSLVADVLDALGLDAVHLVATSFGGYTAMHTAAAHPDRIRRAVHFGWLTGAPVAHLPLWMRVSSIGAVARLGTAIPPNARMVRAMFQRIGLKQALAAGKISDELVACYLALLRDTDTMRNELTMGSGRFVTLRGLDEQLVLPDALLAGITTPMYFLWGEEDPFGGGDVARQIVDRIPGAQLEMMPGAGHAVWLDDPDHAAAVTSGFLAGVEGGTPG